jgi:hypothetical protein
LDPEPTARVLIAAFQGMTLQHTWDKNIDARSCLRVIRSLLVTE